MAFTLAKAMEDIEERLGPYSESNWRMGNLLKVRIEHSPFSELPIRGYFEQIREHSGNRRTPNMYMHFDHTEGHRYYAKGGTVFRMVVDFSEPTSAWFATDGEVDQSNLWATPRYDNKGLTDIWENNRYFRMPTYELPGQIRFKLRETSKTIILYPGEI